MFLHQLGLTKLSSTSSEVEQASMETTMATLWRTFWAWKPNSRLGQAMVSGNTKVAKKQP